MDRMAKSPRIPRGHQPGKENCNRVVIGKERADIDGENHTPDGIGKPPRVSSSKIRKELRNSIENSDRKANNLMLAMRDDLAEVKKGIEELKSLLQQNKKTRPDQLSRFDAMIEKCNLMEKKRQEFAIGIVNGLSDIQEALGKENLSGDAEVKAREIQVPIQRIQMYMQTQEANHPRLKKGREKVGSSREHPGLPRYVPNGNANGKIPGKNRDPMNNDLREIKMGRKEEKKSHPVEGKFTTLTSDVPLSLPDPATLPDIQ